MEFMFGLYLGLLLAELGSQAFKPTPMPWASIVLLAIISAALGFIVTKGTD